MTKVSPFWRFVSALKLELWIPGSFHLRELPTSALMKLLRQIVASQHKGSLKVFSGLLLHSPESLGLLVEFLSARGLVADLMDLEEGILGERQMTQILTKAWQIEKVTWGINMRVACL